MDETRKRRRAYEARVSDRRTSGRRIRVTWEANLSEDVEKKRE